METLDIVALVQNHPLTRLKNYESHIIKKIKEHFTTEEQQLWVANFYTYLNYNTRIDFVVDLDRVWKWLGFDKKGNAKSLLTNNFEENNDFKISSGKDHKKGFPADAEKPNLGGRPVETILLTVHCFKKLCLRAKTHKSTEIHEYYVKLEEIMNELVAEQAQDLKQKLLLKDQQIEEVTKKLELNTTEMENNLITNLSNKRLVYLGIVEKNVVKFGISQGIDRRVLKEHKKDFDNFVLKYTILTEQYIELEKLIKNECKTPESVLFDRRISKKYKGKNQTELIQLDSNFDIDDLYQEILRLKDFTQDNMIETLVKENKKLKDNIIKKDLHILSIVQDKHISEEIQNELKQNMFTGIKCTRCGHAKQEDEYSINEVTKQLYSNCNVCRKLQSEKTFEKSRHQRELREQEDLNKSNLINQQREQMLINELINCYRCKKDKTPEEIGINKRTNKMYKICARCRGVDHADIVNDESVSECSKCHYEFETTLNPLSKQNYKTCSDCRQKDKLNDKLNKELLTQEIVLECTYCHKQFDKELNAKKDGFYKNCKPCRDSRKKYDQKRNKDNISQQKKEYYIKNKEEIRAKQKEYYDNKD